MIIRFLSLSLLLSGVALTSTLALSAVEPPTPRVLNNLVTELLAVESPRESRYAFRQPREGFLFIQLAPGSEAITAEVNGKPVALRHVEGKLEGMLHVNEGTHQIAITGKPLTLVVRAVGELVYCMYGKAANPYIEELGDYTWEYLREQSGILNHFNVIVGHHTHTDERELNEWTAEGKWWTTMALLQTEPESVESQVAQWWAAPGATHPKMKGFSIDEFIPLDEARDTPRYAVYRDAALEILDRPEFEGRRIYPFVVSDFNKGMAPFIKAMAERKQIFIYEWYIRTMPADVSMKERLDRWQDNRKRKWEATAPGSASSLQLVAVCLHGQPPFNFDEYPHVDFYTHLDRSMEYLATSPYFEGIRGIMGYYTPYCSEDQLRLFARLLRHYAIEGKKSRLLDTPYLLPHLTNPDFANNARGWRRHPAETDSISTVVAEGFGKLQGRTVDAPGHLAEKEGTRNGDSALLTRRSSAKPNRVEQTAKSLKPGQLYVLRFFTGNLADLRNGASRRYRHAVNVEVEGGEILKERCFQAEGGRFLPQRHELFNAQHPYFWNYHQIVFRAKEPKATVILSDWANSESPGGEPGEELIWNHMKLHPYFEEAGSKAGAPASGKISSNP